MVIKGLGFGFDHHSPTYYLPLIRTGLEGFGNEGPFEFYADGEQGRRRCV